MKIIKYSDLGYVERDRLYYSLKKREINTLNSFEKFDMLNTSKYLEYGGNVFICKANGEYLGYAYVVTKNIAYNGIAYVFNLVIKKYISNSSKVTKFLLKEIRSYCIKLGALEVQVALEGFNYNLPESHRMIMMELQLYGYKKVTNEANIEFELIKTDTIEEFVNMQNNIFKTIPNYDERTFEEIEEIMFIETSKIGFVKRFGEKIGIFEVSKRDEALWIEYIGIDYSSRGNFFGEVVLEKIIKDYSNNVECYRLIVASSNYSAMELYKKIGFKIKKEVSKWYKL